MGISQSVPNKQKHVMKQKQKQKQRRVHETVKKQKRTGTRKGEETFISYTDVLNQNAVDTQEHIPPQSQTTRDVSIISGMALPGGVYGVTDGTDPLSSYKTICDHCEDTIIHKNHNHPQFSPSSSGVYPHPETSMYYKPVCNTQSVSNTCKLTKNM